MVKKYHKHAELIPLWKVWSICFGLTMLTWAVLLLFRQKGPSLYISLGCVFPVCGMAFYINWLQQCGIEETYLQVYLGAIKIRKIMYSTVHALVISNASEYAPGAFAPTQLSIHETINGQKRQRAYVTMVKTGDYLRWIKKGMTNHGIAITFGKDKQYDFIFDHEAFMKLVTYMVVDVYILEDVYQRYKKEFMEAIRSESKCRFIIVKNSYLDVK